MNARKLFACAAALGTIGASAFGVVINPGQWSVLVGTNGIQSPWLNVPSPGATGAQFAVLGAPFVAIYSGQLLISFGRTVPLEEPVLFYRIQQTWAEDTTRRISSISFTGYKDIRVESEFRTDQSGDGEPKRVRRSADGDVITFEFETPIPGNVAATKFFYTYTNGANLVFDGTATITLLSGESATITGLPRPSLGVAPPAPTCPGDTNADGVINFVDLNGVLTNFGEDCP
jgi:hypothetical protein